MRTLRRLGQNDPRTRSMARRIEVFPAPFGPTIAVSGAIGTTTSSSERKLLDRTALITPSILSSEGARSCRGGTSFRKLTAENRGVARGSRRGWSQMRGRAISDTCCGHRKLPLVHPTRLRYVHDQLGVYSGRINY